MNGHTINNTSVVLDFDRALSKGSYTCLKGGPRYDYTSYSFLNESSKIDKKYFVKNKRLFDYYYKLEKDPKIGPEQKTRYMIEWVMKVYDLYYEYIPQDLMEESLNVCANKLHLREGMLDFISFARDSKIPLLIYSAGIADVIDKVLEGSGLGKEVESYGNRLNFDQSGRFIIPDENEIIHPLNKKWQNVPEDIRINFRERSHMIIGGDSPGDIHMGDTSKDLYSIGFLLDSNQDPDGFKSLYSETIVSEECDMGRFGQIAEQIKQNS